MASNWKFLIFAVLVSIAGCRHALASLLSCSSPSDLESGPASFDAASGPPPSPWPDLDTCEMDLPKTTSSVAFPELHGNYEVTGPKLSSFETSSTLTCIHKCQWHEQCNVVNVKLKANSKVDCVLASVGWCFLGNGKRKSQVWQLYILDKDICYVKNMVHGSTHLDPNPAYIMDKVEDVDDGFSSVQQVKNGPFYLKHKWSGMCLAFDSKQDRLVLRTGACNQTFNEVPETKYLQWEKKKCISQILNSQELTLADNCTSDGAAFQYNMAGELITFNGDNCIWHDEAESHKEKHDRFHNTSVKLRGGCSNEDKLKFEKVYDDDK